MANRPAPALALRDGDREELSRITRSSSVRAGLAQRARIVLAAADGVANEQIAYFQFDGRLVHVVPMNAK